MKLIELKKTEKANLEKKRGIFFELGMVIVLALVLIAFEWSSKKGDGVDIGTFTPTPGEIEIVVVTKPEKVIPPPPQPETILNIVDDNMDLEDEMIIIDTEDALSRIIDFYPDDFEDNVKDTIFDFVSDPPRFQGGDISRFWDWVNSRIRYPRNAELHGESGQVIVQFVINENGDLVNAVIARSVHTDLDDEVLRVVNASPKWEPGMQGMNKVKVRYYMPINFQLR